MCLSSSRGRIHCKSNDQGGSSLLEVLVSLTILAIGILGMNGLQAVSLRSNHSAYLRTQATIYSFDIVERMRANINGVSTGAYNNAVGSENANCNSTVGCNSTELAGHDIFQWQLEMVAGLPIGAGTVCIDSTPSDGVSLIAPACDGLGSLYTVKMWWDDNRDGGADLNYVMSFRP